MRNRTRTRIVLVFLLALLALPIAATTLPVLAKPRTRTILRSFDNTAPINLATSVAAPVSATLYPSTIAVGGMKGKITSMAVILHDFGHTNPDDVEVLLVGPNGRTAIIMANVGGSDDASEVRLRLDSELTLPIPDQSTLNSGNWAPTNATGSVIAFNAPVPPVTSANALLSVFQGASPNGEWRLFVQDEKGPTDPAPSRVAGRSRSRHRLRQRRSGSAGPRQTTPA